MKKFKRALFTAFAGVSLLFAAACGGGEKTSGGTTPPPADDKKDEPKQEAPADPTANFPKNVSIGTASQGGVYYIFGGALGELINRELGVLSSVEVSQGPGQNMQLTNAGDYEISFVTLGPGYEGYNEQNLQDVRIVFPMYTTPFHWWSVDPKIKSIEELISANPSDIGVGPATGTSGTYLPLIHELLGMKSKPVNAGANDMVSAQGDGQLDNIGFAAGLPIPALNEALKTSRKPITVFGIDGDLRDKVIAEFPAFDKFTIPANTYDGVDQDIETISMFNFGIVHKDLDEEFVYALVKAFHANIDTLANTTGAIKEATHESILKNTVIPLHPGAIRYYEEVGVKIPDSLK